MPRYFLEYLTYIRTKQPQVLSGIPGIIASSNIQGPNVIAQMLKGFPPVLENFPPFDPTLIASFAQEFQDFLYQDNYVISAINKLATNQHSVSGLTEYLAGNPAFSQFMIGLINICCAELVDENGDLYEAISKLFLINIKHPKATPEIKRIFFIKSFLNEIILPAITGYWINQPEFKPEMLEKIGTNVMLGRIFENSLRQIIERSIGNIAYKSDTRLKNAIIQIQKTPALLTKIYNENMAYLVEAIIAIPVVIEQPSLFDSLINMVSGGQDQEQEESLQTSIEETLSTATVNAYGAILNSIIYHVSQPLITLSDHIIISMLNDIKLHGKPLTMTFANTDYRDYISTRLGESDDDYPIKFSDESVGAPFTQEVLHELVAYFHHYLINEIQYLDNFKKYKNFNFFIKKINLFAYSQVLDSEGKVKAEIVELFQANNHNLNPEDDLRVLLIYGYLHKMLVTIIVTWLENSEYQKAMIENKKLYRLVNKIEKALKKGLDLDFLNQLSCFPTFGNKSLSPNFVIPLSVPAGKNNIKSVIVAVEEKLKFVRAAGAAYLKFSEMHLIQLNLLNTRQTSLYKKMTFYKAAMKTPAELLNAVKSAVSDFDVDFEKLEKRVTQLVNQPQEFYDLLKELTDNYHTKTLPEVESCLQNILKKMADFELEIVATKDDSATLNSGLTAAKRSGEKMVALERFYNEMLAFVNQAKPQVLDLSKLALASRERYLLRKDFFPRALYNSAGWNYSLAIEDSIIRTTFTVIRSEFVTIKEVCDNLKSCGFADLLNCNYDADVWRERTALQINKLVAAAQVIEKASKPLFTVLEGSRDQLEEIYGMMKFILEDKSLWQHCISPFFGGVKYSEKGVDYRFATRGVAMMKAANELPQDADPDLKIMAVVSAFNNTTAGYGFWRFNEITEFYKIIQAINELANGSDKRKGNLYSIQGLSLIKMQLKDFMKKTCEPKFQTSTHYEELMRGVKPQAAPNMLSQVVDGISSAMSRMIT